MTELVEVVSRDWGPQICKGLKELYDEKIGCNVAIYGSDGGILDGHACVLMAVSPTLKTWLAGDPIQGCHSVEIDTITCDIWKFLLEFMYTGKVTVDKDIVHEVLDAAEKLSMNHLIEACEMASNPSKKSHQNNVGTDLTVNTSSDKKDKVNNVNNVTDLSKKRSDACSEYDKPDVPEESGEQPLDLTKMTAKPANENAVTNGNLDITKIPEQLLANGQLPLPPIPPNADPQMQAVMAVYYNQMIQYSMLAQNLKNGSKDRMPNLPPPPQLPPGLKIPAPQNVPQPPTSTMMSIIPSPQFLTHHADSGIQDGRQRKFPCSICGMLFFTRHVKEQHELTHTNLKPYSCNICGFRARQKAVIWRHKKNRHPEADSSVSMDALTTSLPSSPEGDDNNDDNQSNISSTSMGRRLPSPENSHTGILSHINTSHPNSMHAFSGVTTIPTPVLTQPLSSISTKPVVPVDPTKPYVCETCGRGFKNKYILSQHSMIHSNVRRYACDICGFRAKQMSVIYNHKRNKHWGKKSDPADVGSQYSMQINSQANPMPAFSPINMSANQPAITLTNETKRPRDAIDTNDTETNLREIEQEVQSAKRTPAGYLCRICGRSLKTKMILQEHIMTHYNIRRYPCVYCNYRAKQRAGLYNHMKVKHKGMRPIRHSLRKKTSFMPSQMTAKPNPFNPSRRKYMCRTCGKSFRIKHVLEQHELIHLNIKRYSCKYCGFKGKRKSIIYRHNELKHNGHLPRVVDLLKPRFGIPEKITPPLPRDNITPVKELTQKQPQEISTPQDLSQRQLEIKNKLNRDPIVIQPVDIPMEPQDLSIITNKLKSQIVTQQKHLPAAIPSNFTPKLMGTNLVYAMSLPGQQTSPGKLNMSQTPPPMSLTKSCDTPPALFPSYGTPDKPHRCKVCGRCFRLRHVMEQHELTHSNFRKYMCDICGFRAKQKAVIYRHKKVKHPNHPGAGRVALVPEATMGLDNGEQQHQQHQQNDMPPQLVPVSKQLSPSNNPELAHNNNKGIPAISKFVSLINGNAQHGHDDDDERPSPTGSVNPSPKSGMGWYVPPYKDDSEEDEEMSEFSTGESLTANMAMGLPSMVPSTNAINLSLPPIAPLSPDQHSPTDDIDKKYSCQVCGRSFKHRHVLEQHYITHTGLRPYKCEFCDFCARQKASLWRHKQKHLVGGALAQH